MFPSVRGSVVDIIVALKMVLVNTKISASRNVFIIDDKGIVRTILVYPLNVGRFIPEILRISSLKKIIAKVK